MAPSLVAQELPLKRDIPGSSPYVCPPGQTPETPGVEEQRLARQLASTAAQAVILGDLNRARSLLDQAAQLDPTSVDLAYRHARVLEELDEPHAAVSEYCRVLAAGSPPEGMDDARQRLDALIAAELAMIPVSAINNFREALFQANAGHLERALPYFDSAVTQAPDWPAAVYDRGVVLAMLERPQKASRDLRRYLDLNSTAPDALAVARRLGELQAMALDSPTNPGAALLLGVLVPGLGQFYSGDALGGLTVLSLAGSALATGYFVKRVDVQCLSDVAPGGECPASQVVSEDVSRPYLQASIGAAAAVTVVGAVVAFVHARQRRRAQPAGPGNESNVAAPRLALPTVQRHGPNVDIALVRLVFR
jgi:tetratricopeptide (TPR) repeat protein